MTDEKPEIKISLDDVTKAVVALNATQAGIAKLVTKHKDVVFDCSDSKEMTAAKVSRREIREPRYNIEHLRKEAKAPVIALGKSLDAMAAGLTAELLALETPIDEQIKAEETRIADEQLAAIAAETKRVADIKARIVELFDGVQTVINKNHGSKYVSKCIAAYKDKPVDDSFDEFMADAEQTWNAGLDRLEKHLDAIIEQESLSARLAQEKADAETARKTDAAEQQRIAAENVARQADLDKQQRKLDEEEARLKQERKDAEEADAARQKELDDAARAKRHEEAETARIEQERKNAERQAELDEQAAAQKVIDDEQAAAQKLIDDENARLAQEKADAKAEERAEQARKDAAEAAAKKAIYPGDDAVAAALITHFGVPDEVARKWINHIKGTTT